MGRVCVHGSKVDKYSKLIDVEIRQLSVDEDLLGEAFFGIILDVECQEVDPPPSGPDSGSYS